MSDGSGQVENPEELRSFAMLFESLGGGGHGCEFGLFQRAIGAEPLGLLRWADLGPDQLARALESRLAGIGDPAHIRVFAGDEKHNSEWWSADRRYHMAMRTFIKTADMDYDAATVANWIGYTRSSGRMDLAISCIYRSGPHYLES